MRLATAAVVALGLAGSDADGGDSRELPESRFGYVRDAASPADAVKRVVAAAAERGAESIAFVLDRATFDPPPKVSEFTMSHAYAADRRAWLDAAAAITGGPPISLALTTSERLRGTAASDVAALEAECNGDIWRQVGSSRPILPARKWIDSFTSQLKGARKAVVLVTGEAFPESSFRMVRTNDTPSGEQDPWRSSLLPRGAYWDEEAVAEVARRGGATLLVVAPEAKFGDCQPIDDVPEAPYASRPRARPVEDEGKPRKRAGRRLDEPVRLAMADELRKRGFDEAEVSRALALKDKEALDPPDGGRAGRFDSAMPLYFPRLGDQLVTNTDCPSGYGVWRLARAAAATGGAYVLYPFPRGRWMDGCFRDETLLDALAPPRCSRERFASLAKDDDALALMLTAQSAVLEVTPWTDYTKGYTPWSGGLTGWCGFELPGPQPAKRWSPRTKPMDQEYYLGTPRETAAAAARAVEKYRRAIRGLDAAASGPRVAAAPRRSQANLRLCRFWFETSLFHLQSLELACREPALFGAHENTAKKDDLGYWRAVRLSDCLPAYDGRVVTAWDEKSYGPMWAEDPDYRAYQGAFLNVPSGDPNYRAQRDVERVLRRLDPRLRAQALQVIAAARAVIDHEARSPWGWVVYYSELQTYGWSAVDDAESTSDRAQSEPQHATTPAGSTASPGTSTPK
jgi:hypothetical protein